MSRRFSVSRFPVLLLCCLRNEQVASWGRLSSFMSLHGPSALSFRLLSFSSSPLSHCILFWSSSTVLFVSSSFSASSSFCSFCFRFFPAVLSLLSFLLYFWTALFSATLHVCVHFIIPQIAVDLSIWPHNWLSISIHSFVSLTLVCVSFFPHVSPFQRPLQGNNSLHHTPTTHHFHLHPPRSFRARFAPISPSPSVITIRFPLTFVCLFLCFFILLISLFRFLIILPFFSSPYSFCLCLILIIFKISSSLSSFPHSFLPCSSVCLALRMHLGVFVMTILRRKRWRRKRTSFQVLLLAQGICSLFFALIACRFWKSAGKPISRLRYLQLWLHKVNSDLIILTFFSFLESASIMCNLTIKHLIRNSLLPISISYLLAVWARWLMLHDISFLFQWLLLLRDPAPTSPHFSSTNCLFIFTLPLIFTVSSQIFFDSILSSAFSVSSLSSSFARMYFLGLSLRFFLLACPSSSSSSFLVICFCTSPLALSPFAMLALFLLVPLSDRPRDCLSISDSSIVFSALSPLFLVCLAFFIVYSFLFSQGNSSNNNDNHILTVCCFRKRWWTYWTLSLSFFRLPLPIFFLSHS